LGKIMVSEGGLRVGTSGNGSGQTFAGTLAYSGSAPLPLEVVGDNLLLTGTVIGLINKTGSGKLTLSGTSRYESGTLKLSDGILSFSGSPTFGGASQIEFAPTSTGTIQIAGSNVTLPLASGTVGIIENG